MRWIILYWSPRFLYRYFTGLHLDGKVRKLPQSKKVKPQFKNYFWNRYSRPKRAAWRMAGFIVFVGIPAGYILDWWLTRFVLLSVSPFVALWLAKKLLNELTTVTRFTDSDGATDQYRSLSRKWFRRWQRIRGWRFKVAPPMAEAMMPGTAEHMAILAENAEDGGAPVVRLERPLGLAELQMTEGAPGGSGGGRARTTKRAVERRSDKRRRA